MKIGFLAYDLLTLDGYWNGLKDKADCWWGVVYPSLYNILKMRNEINIIYEQEIMTFDKSQDRGNKYIPMFPGKSENIVAEKIDPDLWITDVTTQLTYIPKKTFWIQTFHGLPATKYMFNPLIKKYDLILLPGEYHKKEMMRRLKIGDDNRLKVVGWPKVDDFFNEKYNREKIMKSLGLDTSLKTVMYAPTWGYNYQTCKISKEKIGKSYYNINHKFVFARWLDNEVKIFEQLCTKIKKMNLNFILKLHPLSYPINEKALIDIGIKYDVAWVQQQEANPVSPNPYLWVTDVLISDTSSITSDFMVLDRPIIYIEPDEKHFVWEGSDMPKSYRAGYVVKTPEELHEAIEDSIKFPDKFQKKRQRFISEVFHKLDGKATERAVREILNFADEKGLI